MQDNQTLVCIIIPTLNNKEGGYEALQSIQSSYDTVYMPIIIDNWRTNRCVTESWNLGFEIAKPYNPDYVLVINDDVLFSPWTLTGLVRTMSKKPTENIAMVTGINMRDHMEPEDIFKISMPSYDSIDVAENPDFSCFMMTVKMWETIGTFDENFKPAYFEDNDYHYRIKLAGRRAICTSWAPYYHFGSKTQNFNESDPIVKSEQYNKNAEYYKGKWGAPPMFELFTHPYNDSGISYSKWRLNGTH